jgi:hypothetical protein
VVPANYLAAVCSEKRIGAEDDARERAIALYKLVVENHPNHELAGKAKEDLKRLGVALNK